VVGFKPPFGRVPQAAPFNLDVYCHCGPMARTVADCALFENVLAGPHPHDHVSLRPKLEIPEQLEGVRGLRVAVSPDLGGWPTDPEIVANTLSTAEALREAGAIVEQVDLDIPRDMVDRAAAIHFHLIFATYVDEVAREHGDLMTDYAIEFARLAAEQADGATMLEEIDIEAKLYVPVGELLEDYDALICPTVNTRGLAAGDGYVGRGIEVGGVDLPNYFDSIPTPVFNILSRCPVLAVPSGFADNGVPTGIQIVGRTYDDVTAFRVGAALELLRPWLDRPERQPAFAAGAA
jgi:amidase